MFALLLPIAWVFSAGPAPLPNRPLDQLDLQRYAGTWYELARLPNRFERGCQAATATYEVRADGEVGIENACHKDSLDGPLSKVKGKGWRPDARVEGALKVMFFWPFQGDYWVLEVGPSYEYALVGGPDRGSAWILSRTPTVSDAVYESLTASLAARGYDVAKLERVQQAAPLGSR